ncbi:MAG: glycosyltransferase [Nitrospira sp.]
MLGTWARSFHRIRKKVAWMLYQRRDLQSAAAFHATSQQEACEIRSLGFTQPTLTIPNAIECPSQMPGRSHRGGHRMLFLSRIHPKKGLLTLINAWKQASVPHDWRLAIAGPDENGHQHEVWSRAKDLGIAEQIDFLGPVMGPAKWQLYVDSDVFVLPSYNENFGLVIAEAMAAGLPVITTTATPWDVLREKHLGWCVYPRVPDLVTALHAAISLSDSERAAMGAKAAHEVAPYCSWQSVARQMAEYYHTLLEESPCTGATSRAR